MTAIKNWVEFHQYITPDGVTFDFKSGEKFIMQETGTGMPEIKYITQRGPMQHGESVYDYRLEPRVIQMVFRHNAYNRDDFWTNRANLLDMLRPNRQLYGQMKTGILKRRLSNGNWRCIDALIQQGPTFRPSEPDKWDEWSIMETLQFIAHDPTFYDPTVRTNAWTLTNSGQAQFSFTFDGANIIYGTTVFNNNKTITYAGNWQTFPIFTLTGPMAGLILTNNATGEFIKMNYSIPSGHHVTIDLTYGNKKVLYDDTDNIIGTISSDSDFATFHIAPTPEATAGSNVINALGGGALIGTTAISMTYYDRYIGI